MNGYEIEDRINQVAVPVLSKALSWVRQQKEQIMAAEGKYKCPVEGCGRTGFVSAAGVKRHMAISHKLKGAAQPKVEEPDAEAADASPPPVEPVRPAPQPTPAPTPVEPKTKEPAPEPTPVTVEPAEYRQAQEVDEGEPSSAPPEAVPPTPPPVAAPPTPPSVAVGTVLRLNGPVWWQHPGTGSWEGKVAADLTVQVVQKELSENGSDVMLLCRAQGGSALWSVMEADVLGGKIRVVKSPPSAPAVTSDVRPADGPRQVTDPDYDYFAEEEKARQEAEAVQKQREEYGASLQRYVEARDTKGAAAKAYTKVDEEEREKLFAYIRAHGEPSDDEKEDVEVVDFDIRARITTTPGESRILRKNDVIVQWLKDNDMEDCLRQVLDLPAWEKAKAEGRVPAEFTREVEKPEKDPDKFMFSVTKI
jgi:hypothetical protein